MDKIAQALRAVMTEIQAMPEPQQPGAADRKEFALLLSGIATCRKAPGIPVHMGYESLYRCRDQKDAEELKAHLSRLYGIHDRESLEEACMKQYTAGREYEQFMTFWCGAPLFDLEGAGGLLKSGSALPPCSIPMCRNGDSMHGTSMSALDWGGRHLPAG